MSSDSLNTIFDVGGGLPIPLKTVPIGEEILYQSPVTTNASLIPFSEVSNFDFIATTCVEKVPGWSLLVGSIKEDIKIRQLMEGLSNQLFQVTISVPSSKVATSPYRVVLFRVRNYVLYSCFSQ